MNPIKFKIAGDPDIYTAYKVEHDGNEVYVLLFEDGGELISQVWSVETVEDNFSRGIWREVVMQ